jgi:hypothetical protein
MHKMDMGIASKLCQEEPASIFQRLSNRFLLNQSMILEDPFSGMMTWKASCE